MYIINGRTLGDTPGRLTHIQSNGGSTIDYALASIKCKPIIRNFYVTPLDGFSDHCLISLSLEMPKTEETCKYEKPLSPTP